MNKEQQVGNKTEDTKAETLVGAQVENQNNIGAEKGISKGEDRYNKIADSINGARSKVSGWLSRGASKFGSLFKAAAVGVLNSPEAIATGANAVKEKTVEGAQYVGKKYTQAEIWVEKQDEKANEFMGKVGERIGYNVASAYETTTENLAKAKNFTAEKAIKARDYIKDKAATVEAVGSLVKERTVEKLNIAKEGIQNNYGKAVEYGKDAVDTAKLRAWYAKDAFNNKLIH